MYDASKSKWREARVIEVIEGHLEDGTRQVQAVKVHFKGLHSKFDEVIDKADFEQLISPISRHLSKRKAAKKVKENNENVNIMNDAGQ